MSETCKHPDSSFDRTLCAEPCGAMHNYCTECGECVDPCPHKATPSSGVTEGKAESDGYPFMTVQDAIETAILARGVDVPDLADVVFVAAEAVQALWAAPQSPAPADDAAEVLAGLLAGFEHERWWSADDEVKFGIWTKAMKRVEAAQQRLVQNVEQL